MGQANNELSGHDPGRRRLPRALAAECRARLETAVALLVTRPSQADAYTLSVSCQAGLLQDVWLSDGRHAIEDLPADPAAAGVAEAVRTGFYGPENARALASAADALAELIEHLTRPGGVYYGTATMILRGRDGQVRVPVEAETHRRWRFG